MGPSTYISVRRVTLLILALILLGSQLPADTTAASSGPAGSHTAKQERAAKAKRSCARARARLVAPNRLRRLRCPRLGKTQSENAPDLTAPQTATGSTPPSQPSEARGEVVTGAYVPDARYLSSSDWMTRLNQYDQSAGRRPSVVLSYSDFSDDFPAVSAETVSGRGQTPFITYETNAPQYTAAAIASGSFDAQLRHWAEGARAWGRPFYARFLCEANGDWDAWSPGTNGNTAAQYVAAYRHIHDVFASVGATNAKFAWTPINSYPGSTPLRAIYPGDAYVDLVGIDGFNWGATHASGWESFSQVFGPSLTEIRAFTAKPIWLTEVGSSESGGDKAAWIKDMFATIARDTRISGLIWFNANKETDWRIDSSSGALAAWRTGVASSLYSSAP